MTSYLGNFSISVDEYKSYIYHRRHNWSNSIKTDHKRKKEKIR